MAFVKATKKQARLRLGLMGPSGAGKTFTALRVATGLGGRIAVIDTERGSASKYADKFSFDVMELQTFAPATFVSAIKDADDAGYDVLIIDSLSHAWSGKDGALEQVDKVQARSKSSNSYTAWREVTPMHNALVDAILQSKCHVIVTMRVKTEYVMEKDERTGKMAPRKVGLQPIQRDGMEYELDLVADIDDAKMVVTKSRISQFSKAVIAEPGEDVGRQLREWLNDGAPAPTPAAERRETPAPSTQSAAQVEQLDDESTAQAFVARISDAESARDHALMTRVGGEIAKAAWANREREGDGPYAAVVRAWKAANERVKAHNGAEVAS